MAQNLSTSNPHGGYLEISSEGSGEVFLPGTEEFIEMNAGDSIEFYPEGGGELVVDGNAIEIPVGTEIYLPQGGATYTPYDANYDYLDPQPLQAGSYSADGVANTSLSTLTERYPNGGYIEISGEGSGEVFLPGQEDPIEMGAGDSIELYPEGGGELVVGGDAVELPVGSEVYLPFGQATVTPYDKDYNSLPSESLGAGSYLAASAAPASPPHPLAGVDIPPEILQQLASANICGVANMCNSDTPAAGTVGSRPVERDGFSLA